MRLHALVLMVCMAATSVEARIVDRIVAVVNEAVITQSELEDSVKVQLARIAQVSDQQTLKAKRKVILERGLKDLIGKKLIAQEAIKRSIKIEDKDVEQHLRRVQNQQGWSEQQMQMYLTSQGMTMSSFKSVVRENLLEQRVIGIVLGSRIRISDRDLEDYYKERRTKISRDFEVDAAHIVFKVATGASANDEAAVRMRAVEIMERAKAGEDFSELAKSHSEGPGAARGGNLGTLRKGNLNPKLEAAIFSISEGQIGGPFRSPFGYHVIKVTKRRQLPPKSFESVKGTLRNELHRKKLSKEMEQWIADLRKKAFIDVRSLN
ncbi:MAG: peptidylprolyl isomerase [Myxococcota bacterium]|nr:peptidylprolyl isomerase [Myxococcota bacterium]